MVTVLFWLCCLRYSGPSDSLPEGIWGLSRLNDSRHSPPVLCVDVPSARSVTEGILHQFCCQRPIDAFSGHLPWAEASSGPRGASRDPYNSIWELCASAGVPLFSLFCGSEYKSVSCFLQLSKLIKMYIIIRCGLCSRSFMHYDL